MRRVIAVSMVLVICLVIDTVTSLAQNGQLTLTHLANGSHHDAHRKFVEEKAYEFSLRHPEVSIEIVAAPGNYVEKVLIAAAGGVSYDVIEPTSSQIADIVNQNLLLDLSPFLQRSGLSRQDFIPVALLPFTWDSALVGLPTEINAVTTISNVRLFQEAGLETPGQLGKAWNWDTLRTIAPKLSADTQGVGVNDRWAVTLNPSFHRIFPAFVHNAGGDAYDAQIQPRNATFSKDSAVGVGLQFYLDLYWREWLSTDAKTFRSEERTAISLLDGSWWIGLSEELADPFEYEVAPFPGGPARQGSEALANGFCIGVHSQAPEKAFEWIKFLAADYDNAIEYMQATGRPTAYLKATPRFPTLFDKHPPSISVWIEVLSHPDVRIRNVTPVYTAVQTEFNARFRDVMSRQRGLTDFLEHMQRFAQSRLDEVWRGR